jgi:predicted O-methyltransferase YrrM
VNLAEFYDRAYRNTPDIAGHLPGFIAEVIDRAAAQVIEVGVGAGNSSAAWLTGLAQTGGRLWSVDIEPTPAAWELQDICPEWTYVVGDSIACEPFAPHGADILFIDSLHTFEQTLAELEVYVPHVKPGGVVLLHDTGTHPPVAQAITAFCGVQWSNLDHTSGLGRIDL